VGFGEQVVEVVKRAEARVDAAVVGDVIAGILLRRGEERREPDGVEKQFLELRQPLRDAREVAETVAVRVCE
jgi:hypothetical protein